MTILSISIFGDQIFQKSVDFRVGFSLPKRNFEENPPAHRFAKFHELSRGLLFIDQFSVSTELGGFCG